MIGEDYLELRAELGTGLYALGALASDTRYSTEASDTIHKLGVSLREPFLFVVVGEVKAGKSSLLNAIFGREFCKVDVLPATDRIGIFRYDQNSKDVELGPHLSEHYRPINFLRDFNLVDTPGTNTIIEHHQEITERYLPVADLILFVFSITNPWAASGWEFLKQIQGRYLKNVAFVLQQADLRDPQEVDAVRTHLQQTAKQKLHRDIPVFAVSAKKALLARNGSVDPEGLLKESGFPELEAFINSTIAGVEAHRGKLKSVCTSAQVVLSDIDHQMRSACATIRKDEQQIEAIKTTMLWMQEQTLRQVDGFMRGVEQAYDVCRDKGEAYLIKKLRFWQTLKLIFGKGEWQRDFHLQIEEEIKESIRAKMENALQLLESELRSVWKQLQEALESGFTTGRGAEERKALADFSAQRRKLLDKIDLTLAEMASGDRIEHRMEELFTDTATWVRVPLGTAAAGGIATVLVGNLFTAAMADITGVLAALATVGGSFVAFSKRRKILDGYREGMASRREELTRSIEEHLKHAIKLFYQDFAHTFRPLEAFCSQERNRYEPLIDRAEQIAQTLSRIAVRL